MLPGRDHSRCFLSLFVLSSLGLTALQPFAFCGLKGMLVHGADDAQIYYGFVPPGIFWYKLGQKGWFNPEEATLVNETITREAFLAVAGNHDSTSVKLYELPSGRLLADTRLDKLGKAVFALPNGSFFKLVSSAPVTAVLMGGVGVERGLFGQPRHVEGTSTFYADVDGRYAGKEFIFIPVHAKSLGFYSDLPVRVLALEDSEVTVSDANGSTVASFRLLANEERGLALISTAVYRLVSTGRVMVQGFAAPRSLYYPAVEGGFVGKIFYGIISSAGTTVYQFLQASLIVTAVEDSKITLYDAKYGKKTLDTNVQAGQILEIDAGSPDLKTNQMVLRSDRPVMVMLQTRTGGKSGETWPYSAGGIGLAGLKAGQTADVNVPKGWTYAFAAQETVLSVDDVTVRLPADGYFPIPTGTHKVSADANIILESIDLEEKEGLPTFATSLPSAQSLALTNENLRLKPVVSEELPWTYIGVGVLVAAVVAVWQLSRRKTAHTLVEQL